MISIFLQISQKRLHLRKKVSNKQNILLNSLSERKYTNFSYWFRLRRYLRKTEKYQEILKFLKIQKKNY
jgi:hypothetical protein